ncbi:hypothetical protein GCM10010465_20310 [Actinomadura fibrosa]
MQKRTEELKTVGVDSAQGEIASAYFVNLAKTIKKVVVRRKTPIFEPVIASEAWQSHDLKE